MSEFTYAVRNIIMGVWFFYLPVLIIVGTIANCLCIIVTFRTGLKDMVSRYYFIGMTIAHEASLITLGSIWLLGMIQSSYMISDVYRILAMYVPSFFRFLSDYFILAFIVERFKATRLPPRREQLKTTRLITCGITVLGLLPVAYWLFVYNDLHYRETENQKMLHIFTTIIKTIIFELGPYITIIVLSTQIFTMIRKELAMGNIVTNTTNGTHGVSGQHSSNIMSIQETKITKMLVTVAVVYVCLNIFTTALGFFFALFQEYDQENIILTLWNISSLFAVTCLGITFFVCCVVDQDFRRTALATILCRRYPHSNVSQRVLYTRVNHELNAPILTESSGNYPVLQKTTNSKAHDQLGDCADV